MSLIIFKNFHNESIALRAGSIVKVSAVDERACQVTYSVGKKAKKISLEHPVEEVVDAVNKVTGTWL